MSPRSESSYKRYYRDGTLLLCRYYGDSGVTVFFDFSFQPFGASERLSFFLNSMNSRTFYDTQHILFLL
jgi:hypothetical protein